MCKVVGLLYYTSSIFDVLIEVELFVLKVPISLLIKPDWIH